MIPLQMWVYVPDRGSNVVLPVIEKKKDLSIKVRQNCLHKKTFSQAD